MQLLVIGLQVLGLRRQFEQLGVLIKISIEHQHALELGGLKRSERCLRAATIEQGSLAQV